MDASCSPALVVSSLPSSSRTTNDIPYENTKKRHNKNAFILYTSMCIPQKDTIIHRHQSRRKKLTLCTSFRSVNTSTMTQSGRYEREFVLAQLVFQPFVTNRDFLEQTNYCNHATPGGACCRTMPNTNCFMPIV